MISLSIASLQALIDSGSDLSTKAASEQTWANPPPQTVTEAIASPPARALAAIAEAKSHHLITLSFQHSGVGMPISLAEGSRRADRFVNFAGSPETRPARPARPRHRHRRRPAGLRWRP